MGEIVLLPFPNSLIWYVYGHYLRGVFQSWTSRHVFQSFGLVTPKSRLDLGLSLGTLCLESRLRHCCDVGKAHRSCKYVIIFSKNRLFVRFLAIWASWSFLNLHYSHSRIKSWQSLSGLRSRKISDPTSILAFKILRIPSPTPTPTSSPDTDSQHGFPDKGNRINQNTIYLKLGWPYF